MRLLVYTIDSFLFPSFLFFFFYTFCHSSKRLNSIYYDFCYFSGPVKSERSRNPSHRFRVNKSTIIDKNHQKCLSLAISILSFFIHYSTVAICVLFSLLTTSNVSLLSAIYYLPICLSIFHHRKSHRTYYRILQYLPFLSFLSFSPLLLPSTLPPPNLTPYLLTLEHSSSFISTNSFLT